MGVGIIVAPHQELVLVQKVAIATVETRWATFRPGFKASDGVPVGKIPFEHRLLAAQLQEAGKRFIERMVPRGLDFVDLYDLHVYGPSASYNLADSMSDINSYNVAPEEAVGLVKKADPFITDVCDYRLVGNFIQREVHLDEPVAIPIGRPGARSGESVQWFLNPA